METLIDVSSSGREEVPFPTQRIGLDRGVCDAASGDARPSIAAYVLGEATQRHSSRGNFHLISIRSCHER